jgi:hypothetical protein
MPIGCRASCLGLLELADCKRLVGDSHDLCKLKLCPGAPFSLACHIWRLDDELMGQTGVHDDPGVRLGSSLLTAHTGYDGTGV